jgi:hypothetical protein
LVINIEDCWTSDIMLGATTRTTIALPAALLAATDQAVTAGKAKTVMNLLPELFKEN